MGGRKNVILPIYGDSQGHLINAVSMGATFSSGVENLQYLDDVGLHVKWSSSNAVGVITIEGSNNYDEKKLTGSFFALTFNPALTQPNSDSQEYGIDLTQFPFSWLRVTYTRTSGTGTLDVWLTAKEI